jgi:hypothetical protein
LLGEWYNPPSGDGGYKTTHSHGAKDDQLGITIMNLNRRHWLAQSSGGLGGLALASLLGSENSAAAGTPLASHSKYAPAKSVIFLFMAGGPSHVDTFDPKPLLEKLDGQRRPESFGEAKYQFVRPDARLLGSARRFRKHGQSGVEVSDLFPNVAKCIDDIAVIRSCHGDKVVHSAAQYELFSGRTTPGFPSMGSWITYGLGSETESLPSYIVMPDPDGALEAGQPMYANGFLPALHQPTMFRPGATPVRNLKLPTGVSISQRRKTVQLIRELNEANAGADDDELAARIQSYELAFKMQTQAPEVFDLTSETKETQNLYGVGSEPTDDYGRRCLLARRLVEQGVRFVTVVSGGGPGNKQWDAHKDVEENHLRLAPQVDQPIAALLTDLKRRGLLESTLIIWGGEFGRSPEAQGGRGRDHHNLGFTMWMAGGGIKGGHIAGATDEIGLKAVERPYHFRDIHTTILHQLGLNQEGLTYLHLGRRERITELLGEVIDEVIA